MSNLQFIEATLTRAERRRRCERAFRGMWQGLLAGALVWLLAMGAYKLFPIPPWLLPTAAAAGVLAVLAGVLIGAWRKTSLAQTARWVDGKQHLEERLSTALELSKSPVDETWRELLVTDAAAHAKELDPRRLVPFRLPRVTRWAMLALALSAGLGFVPEYRSKDFRQKQADQKNIKEVGRQLAELTRRNLEKRPPALETTEKAMESVGELGDHLAKQSLTRSDALKDLANVTDKLKQQVDDMGKDPMMRKMEQAARASGGQTTPDAARLQKQIDEMQKQMGTPTGTPDAMDKLQKDLEKAMEAAKAAADKNSGLSQDERQKLSQSLTALSKQAQEMGLQMPNLDQAIAELAANQTDMFLKDMQASLTDLEKTRDMAKSLQQLQQQMEKIGKDLAEQLKNGQPEAAQATLQKMIDQLKSANLTPEQLQKMLAEVTKAVDPASQYGKVAAHLKSAVQKMQQGQKPGAAQSLADAKDELDKLLQQMNDANALMAELSALNKASMCVGTCQGWGQCQNPGSGPGGKPGKGVGTWADENSGWGYDGQQSGGWDNSGIKRADTDSRGLSDRGPGEVPDNLTPSKVKGQFSPGGQMPSITLKGVSIKGQSKVAYEEAATTAQSDAQSALSQEKVPRAYQGAVRDYFDDLKK